VTAKDDFCVSMGRRVREADRFVSDADLLHAQDGLLLEAAGLWLDADALLLDAAGLFHLAAACSTKTPVRVDMDEARFETADEDFKANDEGSLENEGVFQEDEVSRLGTRVVLLLKVVGRRTKKDGGQTNDAG
jgi:hypothetical protein